MANLQTCLAQISLKRMNLDAWIGVISAVAASKMLYVDYKIADYKRRFLMVDQVKAAPTGTLNRALQIDLCNLQMLRMRWWMSVTWANPTPFDVSKCDNLGAYLSMSNYGTAHRAFWTFGRKEAASVLLLWRMTSSKISCCYRVWQANNYSLSRY